MKKLTLCFAILSIIIVSSCEKKQSLKTNSNGIESISNVLNSPKYDGMAQYYKEFLNSNRLGNYSLHSSNQSFQTEFSAGGLFYPDANRKLGMKIGERILINNIVVGEYNITYGSYGMAGIEKIIPQFFGKDISISIVNDSKDNKISDMLSVNLYSPKDFVLDNYSNDLQGNLDRNKTFTINWNADNKNTNGVAIVVDWSGEIQGPRPDGAMGPNIGSKRVRNVDFIEDNGTYVFDGNKMLKDIPKDAMVQIALYRGSYKIVEYTKGADARFSAYSDWYSGIRTVIN